jgi:NAD(P)-dependent dehydrogenase (short-subunit alcohol dehydrogenase family)
MSSAGLNPRLRDWHGQGVWIVGASSGIGRATAEALAGQGARVVVSARQAVPLQALAARHADMRALPLDACVPGALTGAVPQVLAHLGRLDLALYCAGHYVPMRADHLDLDEALRHQDINVGGAWRLLDAVLPVLRAQQRGHVSLVSSVAGYRGLPLALAYGPTKAALTSLAQTLWQDLRPHGIGVSVICPGFVATPLTAGNTHPMPAIIPPEEAARQILRGWARGEFEIHFPKRFSRVMKLLGGLGLLSDRAAFALLRRTTGG